MLSKVVQGGFDNWYFLIFFIAVFVKQEPDDQHMKRQMQHAVVASASALAAAGQNNVNAGYVSSTTHMNGYNLPNRPVNGQPNAGKTFYYDYYFL